MDTCKRIDFRPLRSIKQAPRHRFGIYQCPIPYYTLLIQFLWHPTIYMYTFNMYSVSLPSLHLFSTAERRSIVIGTSVRPFAARALTFYVALLHQFIPWGRLQPNITHNTYGWAHSTSSPPSRSPPQRASTYKYTQFALYILYRIR